MYRIDVGEEVTLARPVFQGAWGILGGTRCRVLAVTPPQKPEQPTILTLTPVGASNGLALRAPAQETMEGVINIMEAQNQGLNNDVLVFMQGIDAIKAKYPEAAKSLLEQCLLKMSPTGRDLAVNRPDKEAPPVAAPAPAPAPAPKKPKK